MSRTNGQKPSGVDIDDLAANVAKLDRESREAFPWLFSLLDPRWEGKKCTWAGATISIKPIGGAYRVTVACNSGGAEFNHTAFKLLTALQEFEEHLASGRLAPVPDFDAKKKARQRLGY
jgi:hypothetical protein